MTNASSGPHERPWAKGTLLYGPLGSTQPSYWRVVHVERGYSLDGRSSEDESDTLIHLLEVDPLITPHSTALPTAYRLDLLKSRLSTAVECVRIPLMRSLEHELPSSVVEERNANFATISALVSDENLPLLLNKSARAGAISRHSLLTGLSSSAIRKALHRYWWFGCDANSMISLSSRQGGPGRQRLRPGDAKRGTPNAVALDEPLSRHRGVNYDERHREKFIQALIVYWMGKGLTIADTYEQMTINLYRSPAAKSDGTSYYRRVPLYRIPTLDTFYRRTRMLIAELGLKQRDMGKLDYATAVENRSGSARDISSGPGDIFDMDATEFNFELVASFDAMLALGKPTVYTVVDRDSTCILGLYVECRPERWEGYRRALYCAFTPKSDLIDRLGMQIQGPRVWDVYGVPNGIFSDRGPGRSNMALEALCKELKLEKAHPPAHTPYLNAVVESLQGRLQNRLSILDGGYTRKKGQRAKDQHREARSKAKFNEEQFFRLLVAAADDHNRHADASHLVRPEMGNIQAVPQEIFKWGLRNSPVDHHRHMDHADLYARLLPHDDRAVTNKGVRVNKAYYVSDELQAWRKRQPSKNRLKISVYPDADPMYLYWRPTPTTWKELSMVKADQAKFSGMRWSDIDAYIKRGTKGRIVGKSKGHAGSVFNREAEKIVREAAASVDVATRRESRTNQSVRSTRNVANKKQLQELKMAGRSTMVELTKQGGSNGSADVEGIASEAASPKPKKKANTGELSLRELRHRVFGK